MSHPLSTADDTKRPSPFARQLVHQVAGLELTPGSAGPRFEDEVWNLNGLAGVPVQFWAAVLRWDFTLIHHHPWRWVAREVILALLAPDHDRVALLPWANRTALSPNTCSSRLGILTGWLNWLTAQGITSLGEITQLHCDRYLQHHRDRGLHPSTLTSIVQAITDIARYGPLLSTDRYTAEFLPWPGHSATSVGGHRRPGENRTPPVPDEILRPALHAALYLVETIGPHLAAATPTRQPRPPRSKWKPQPAEMHAYFHRQITTGQPLTELDDHHVADRITSGWDPQDPLLRLSFGPMAHELGCREPRRAELDTIRDVAQAAVAAVGITPPMARDATEVERADNQGQLPWTPRLSYTQFDALVSVVHNACLLLTATISGMRSGELMEITTGSCLPPRQVEPELFRFALGSKRIKGEQFGGTPDEWIVIEPAYRAVELAARLRPRQPGQLVFGRFSFVTKFNNFRRWVNSPAGARLGLAPIPDGRVNARMLRRSLALELAHRPHGLFAAKLHLKQISVATTEGYAARPGGAQAHFHAEVAEEQRQHRHQLTLAAFRTYQAGQPPAGPGARSLIATFQHVDQQLTNLQATQPTIVATDRHVELLLKKRADTLHVQAANYCWFTDPAKALCLKLAGTPEATQPLAGLCDAARCPQATFHPEHRDIWVSCANTTKHLPRQPPHPRRGEDPPDRRTRSRPSRGPRHRHRPPRHPGQPAMTISDTQRQQTEARIRSTADRLLAGDIPPGGKCDIKTLAAEAGVSRAALYRTYRHLKDEFEHRLARLRAQGKQPDPRNAQLTRLKDENTKLRRKIADLDQHVADLTAFQTTAISQIAAQHDELQQLRQITAHRGKLVALTDPRSSQ